MFIKKITNSVGYGLAPVTIAGSSFGFIKPNFSLCTYTCLSQAHVKRRGQKARPEVSVHSVSLLPDLGPLVAIPAEHDVVRKNRSKDYVLLENDGLLDINVFFNLADRKSLGSATEKRRLSMLYKVDCNYFKKTINAWLANALNLPLGQGNFLSLSNFTQTLEGTINNVPLTMTISPLDFQNQPIQGSVAQDGGATYLKVVTYKFAQQYNSIINNLISAQSTLPGTRIVGGQTQIQTGVGANPVVGPITGLTINPQNLQASSGLFA